MLRVFRKNLDLDSYSLSLKKIKFKEKNPYQYCKVNLYLSQ
jgi:hypothetical protein